MYGEEYRAWWCFEHTGFARTKAVQEWQKVSRTNPPETIEEALALADAGALGTPPEIQVRLENKYWRVKAPRLHNPPEPVTIEDIEEAWEEPPF